MSKFGTLVMGPAGAGKVCASPSLPPPPHHLAHVSDPQTTFCAALIQHLKASKRCCYYVNLDPAADDFAYQPDLDIRDLIPLDEAMDEMGLGPNGGLIFCFEYLLEHLDFLTTALEPLSEEYLIVFDLPGQIELCTHVPVVPALARHLARDGGCDVRLCATYLLEAPFVADRAKFFAGTLSAMSAMLLLELPHVNVLSKMDRVRGEVPRKLLKRFIDPDPSLLDDDPGDASERGAAAADGAKGSGEREAKMKGGSFKRLNQAVARLIEDFSMVSFLQLDVQDEDSVGAILSYIDDAIQFHEAQEPKEPDDEVADWEG